jgi:superfamily II DNA/RNA helicase
MAKQNYLKEEIVEAIYRAGFEKPSATQRSAIPVTTYHILGSDGAVITGG